jgi:hypothetical protein
MKKMIFSMFFLTMTFSVNAASNAWSPWTTVTTVYPLDDGSFMLYLDDNSANPANCTTVVYKVLDGNQGKNFIYSAALAALNTKSSVRIYIDGSTCHVSTKYPIIRYLQVK